jgi:hypothetical protein
MEEPPEIAPSLPEIAPGFSASTGTIKYHLPPRRINGKPLSIFNPSTDFSNDNDTKYVDITGDTMVGPLVVQGLTVNTGIALPTAYSTLPNLSLLGGGTKEQFTGSVSTGSSLNILTFSLPTGCYLIIYHISLNNPTTGTNVTVGSLVSGIVSTGNILDSTNGTRSNEYGITLTGGTSVNSYTSINNTVYLTNAAAPINQNLCINYNGTGAVNYTGVLTRIRLG